MATKSAKMIPLWEFLAALDPAVSHPQMDPIQPVPSHAPTRPYPSNERLEPIAMQAQRSLPRDPKAEFLATRWAPTMADQLEALRNDPSGLMMGSVVPMGELAGAVRQGIKAYHGSPHDFDQFSLSKIGTGEGAQAYGHGLYFADNEAVARSYRDQLSPIDINTRADGAPVSHDVQRMIGDSWQTLHGRTQTKPTIQAALDHVDDALMRQRADAMKARDLEWFNKIEDQRLEVQRIRENPPSQNGRMYEVNINASPDDFLDWDAPLSQQSGKVKGAVAGSLSDFGKRVSVVPSQTNKNNWLIKVDHQTVGASNTEAQAWQNAKEMIGDLGSQEFTGREAYQALARAKSKAGAFPEIGIPNPPEASGVMKQAGIPGIKYLDGGSRSAGQGTRNYVVFDDKIISIVKKYGIAGAVAAGLLTQLQARQLAEQVHQQ